MREVYDPEGLRRFRQALFLSMHKMLLWYPWEWYVTLTLDYETNRYAIVDMVNEWVRELQKEEKIQMGVFYLICEKRKHLHVHLLALGIGEQKGSKKTLKNVATKKWRERWKHFAKVSRLENNKSVNNVCRYIALHTFIKKCFEYTHYFYNSKLLKRVMLPDKKNG